MKKCLMFLTVIFLCHSTASAQQSAPAPTSTPSEPAEAVASGATSTVETSATSQPEVQAVPPAEASLPTQAAAIVTAPAIPAAESKWSLGAGLGLAQTPRSDLYTAMILGSGGGFLGALLTFLDPDSVAKFEFFVEYQPLDRLVLMAQARGSFSYLQNDNLASGSLAMPNSRFDWSAGGALGCRFIVNPKGPVEFSLLGIPYVDYQGGRTRYVNNPSDPNNSQTTTLQTGYLVGGVQLGVAVEKELLENLYLRLQTSVLDFNGRWGFMDTKYTGANVQPTDAVAKPPTQVRVAADLNIAPALEIRLRF